MTLQAGDRVLLIAPSFFDYEKEIGDELRRRGCVVDDMADRPLNTPLMHALTRYARGLMIHFAERRHRAKLAELRARDYRLILAINGQTLSRGILRELRRAFPRARLVLYLWDAIANRPSVTANLDAFDECFSFEPETAQAYGLRFRPVFFAPRFAQLAGDDISYDLSFVGTAHTDRYTVVKRVAEALGPEARCYWHLYLQAPWVFRAYKLTNPAYRTARRSEFSFAPLLGAEIEAVFARSRAILDIQHPRQVGLTMRALESVGASRKLVTTNAHARDYDFFDARNIMVIDRARPAVSRQFLESPYIPLPVDRYRRYSLACWMDDVVGAAPLVRRPEGTAGS